MSDFEDKLNSILSSPDQMQRIMDMAKQLSSSSPHSDTEPAGEAQKPAFGSLPDLDPKLLGMVTKLMREYSSADERKTEVLRALRPYLRTERQEAVDRAVELTKLARLARLALNEFSGGEGHV